MWWHTLVIPRLRQDDREFEGRLGYIARSCLRKNKNKNRNKTK
jgi:hypothetical protein